MINETAILNRLEDVIGARCAEFQFGTLFMTTDIESALMAVEDLEKDFEVKMTRVCEDEFAIDFI